ncbi:MAG: type III-B CRISPR module RAMP protein Cmr1 [Candidatus Eisenbacteria bacterium]|jgi:CRISPR type III-B/RAMP module RAMP protein Cmr1|nr:type III-B CRISPR module RAMP protein Cmr1 [Candidatus Eisenbacteria bacterium]
MFVTPAFVTGTGEHAAPVGISTIRELLRWWYRALVGHEAVLGLVDVEQAEAGVFGSPRLKIRSPLQIQVVPGTSFGVIPAGSPAPSSGIILDTTPKLDSIHYLGSGPVGPVARRECDDHGVANEAAFNDPATGKARRGQILRQPAIAAGTTFTIHLSWNDGALDDRQQEDLIRAAASLVALGGIGSRSKKGFGALAGAIDAAEIPEARSWWESQTYGILHGPTLSATAGFPSFPCLAYGIIRPDPVVSSTWEHAMGRLGQLYLAIRPRGAAAWIGGSAHPKRDASVLFSVLSEEEGFRGVATLLPYVQPGEEGARDLRDYVTAFKEFCWPEEG